MGKTCVCLRKERKNRLEMDFRLREKKSFSLIVIASYGEESIRVDVVKLEVFFERRFFSEISFLSLSSSGQSFIQRFQNST